jgi:hypothetical protein
MAVYPGTDVAVKETAVQPSLVRGGLRFTEYSDPFDYPPGRTDVGSEY